MQLASQQRQQPFFKTNTSSATTGSYFLNYNASGNKNGNQNLHTQSQAVARTTSASAMNFFPPNSTVSRQKEKESERETTQTTERLSALHNKLHQEAEKIRKWKTKTDLEINDKTKKLQDANQTIESQRKSILELQLQNEKLSSRLQEELAGHVELEHKATATRELCNVLKDQVFRIDEAVSTGEQDRDELHFSEKQRLGQFQELVVKFQELEIQHSTKYNEMKDKLQKQHEKQVAYVTETTQCIQEKEKQILLLSDEKAEKEVRISALVKDLGENHEHLEVTKIEEAGLKDKLKKSESIITSQDIQLKSAGEMLTYTQDENKKLMSVACERNSALVQFQQEKLKLEHMLKEEENQLILKAESFQATIRNLQNEIDVHKVRIRELTENINMMTSEVENGKKKCDLQKAESERLQQEIDALKTSSEKLITYQEELINCLKELEAEKDSLQEKTSNLTDREKTLKWKEESSKKYITELEAKKVTLEKEIESNLQSLLEKGTLVDSLQMDLEESKKKEHSMQEKFEKLEDLLRKESVNQDNISSDLQEIKAEKLELTKELEQANKEIKNMNQQIKALKKTEVELRKDVTKSSEQRQKLEAEVSQLKAENEDKREELDQTLDLEMNTTKSLRQELNAKEKELSSFDNKTKTMQNQITTKSKQVKDLQQEIKSMKTSSTAQTKRVKVLEKKNESLEMETDQKKIEKEELEKEVEALKNEMAKIQEETANEISELQQLQLVTDKGAARTNDLEAEVKKLKNINEKTVKDKNESQARFDKERAELCSTLENYKTENERIVAQKERDLAKFRQSKETQIEEKIKRIKELEQELEDLNKSKSDSENAINQALLDKDVEINILKQNLLDKDEETCQNVEVIKETPTRMQLVPSTPKTPRSILKQSDQPSKKRRVAFQSENETSYSSDEEDTAFKVFKMNEKKQTGKGRGTGSAIPTKVVRPNVRHSPGPPSQAMGALSKKSTPSLAKNKKKNLQKERGLSDEMEQFKELFPDIPANLPNKKDKKDSIKSKKSPFKSRVTKISPRKKETEIDWFDNDAFFGFDG